jgi:2,5-diketo-D-gluconate reductase A
LRWLIQRDVVVVQKSVRPERMRENIDVFDFELNEEEMTRIGTMDRDESLFFDHRDPAMVGWFAERRLN